jgi:hypothetical protein
VRIAIVGSQEDKWIKEQIVKAKNEIFFILAEHAKQIDGTAGIYNNDYDWSVLTLVSGHCPKGGVDIWAEDIANELGISKEIYEQEVNQWEDEIGNLETIGVCPVDHTKIDLSKHNCNRLIGFKTRNKQIAQACDILYCIVPMRYVGFNAESYPPQLYCKHCKVWKHPTNGACWTMKETKKLGKETHLVVIK